MSARCPLRSGCPRPGAAPTGNDRAVTDPQPTRTGGRLNQAVANAVVRGHSRTVGHGPGKAHAFHHDDTIVVVIRDALTHGERSLVADGRADSVHRLRADLQSSMRAELVRDIEALTGRKVVAFMSATHLEPDLGAEIFVLDGPIASSVSTA
jgi:uncharacterized protein YbcI